MKPLITGGRLMIILAAIVSLTGCSSVSSAPNPLEQRNLTKQTAELQKLKGAEYEDYMAAMTHEESNRKVGNYYAVKGTQVHDLIGQMEQGQPVNDVEISRALDDSDANQYYDLPVARRSF
jgi:hypothetical protein